MIDGLLGVLALLALVLLRMPLATAMIAVGCVGTALTIGAEPALLLTGRTVFSSGFEYALATLPLFILMGNMIAKAGIADSLYQAAFNTLGHVRGGLAFSTILASAGFSAVSGSSMATAATMGQIAMPSMRRYGYAESLASGSIAAGGTLGVLIPPSIVLIVYGILTQNDISLLFIAAIVPSVLGILGYLLAVLYIVVRNPAAGAATPRSTSTPDKHEQLKLLLAVVPVLTLFTFVIGGMYGGLFTAEEAAGVGAAGAMLIAMCMGRMPLRTLWSVLADTAATSASIFAVLFGTLVFSAFMNLSGLPSELQDYVAGLDASPLVIFSIIGVCYLALGIVIEGIAIMMLAIPIFYPIVVAAGFDPIWFGVIIVLLSEISFIMPPLGINLLVLRSTINDLSSADLSWGVLPFIVSAVSVLLILVAWPDLILYLPSLTR